MNCPHCSGDLKFQRYAAPKNMLTVVGPIKYSRAYYWCKCGHGWFPMDEEFALLHKQTPGVAQLASLAGLLAPFQQGAERVLRTMSGLRVSESTIQRTTEDIGQEIDAALRDGDAVAPQDSWEWHLDANGQRCAYLSMDATGVRQQGPHGERADGRMTMVVEVFNPVPQPEDEKPSPSSATPSSSTKPKAKAKTSPKPAPQAPPPLAQARYAAGLMDLEEAGRELRLLADSVRIQNAEVLIGLSDGGAGLADCLENCFSGLPARERVLILDFYHLTEHLEAFGRAWLQDGVQREEMVGRWCHIAKHEGGKALLRELESLDLKGASAPAKEEHRLVVQYIGNNLFRMDYPRYVRAGWQIGSGNIESACKTVINQRLNGGGMRWCVRGTNTMSRVRAVYCSEPEVWEAFWRHRAKFHQNA